MIDSPTLKILHWNANGIRNKKFELFDYLVKNNISICCLNETKLSPDIRFNHSDFKICRLDNLDGNIAHGGVAVIVHKSVNFKLLPHFKTKLIEAIGINVSLQGRKTTIISAYYTGSTAKQNVNLFKRDITKLMSHENVILLGDLNARHTHWGCISANSTGKQLYHILMGLEVEFNIFYPATPTYYPGTNRDPSTIDIVLSNSNCNIDSITTKDDLGSDHLPVLVEIDSDVATQQSSTVQCFNRANWQLFKQHLNTSIDLNEFQLNFNSSHQSIDQAVAKLTTILQDATVKAVPKKQIKSSSTPLSPNILDLIKNRRTVRRQYQRTRHPLLRQMFNEINHLIEKLTQIEHNDKFQSHIESFEPNMDHNKKLWSLSNTLKGKKRDIPALKLDDGVLITDPEKADALRTSFLKNHRTTLYEHSRHQSFVEEAVGHMRDNVVINQDPSTFVTPKELLCIIKKLSSKKAPGCDEIRNIVIKNTTRKFLTALTYIINACIMTAYFPAIWKRAIVIPVHKPGKSKNEITSYRPISLLPTLSKIFEKVILKRLQQHTVSNEIIPPFQFGFREGHSTSHQVRRVVNYIKQGFRAKKSTGMIMLDLTSAFDSVWHDGLIFKLAALNYPRYLISIVNSYITERTFQVKVGSTVSRVEHVPAGVPQGSVVSPELFNIYMADLPIPSECLVAQYADDIALLYSHKRAACINKMLRTETNIMSSYCSDWKLKLNPAKTEATFFTRRRARRAYPRSEFKINNEQVPWKDKTKYLGIHLDKTLTFKNHVNKVIQKSSMCVKLLYPLLNRRSKLHTKNKLLLYKSTIRPIMLYGSPVWGDCADTHKKRIQVAQNRCLKMCLNLHPRHSTTDVHDLANTCLVSDFINKTTLNFKDRSAGSWNLLISSLT